MSAGLLSALHAPSLSFLLLLILSSVQRRDSIVMHPAGQTAPSGLLLSSSRITRHPFLSLVLVSARSPGLRPHISISKRLRDSTLTAS